MRPLLAALLALVSLGVGLAGAANAPRSAHAKAPQPPAAIALVADRRVEEADIRRAALVTANDPLRSKDHALWRKTLLDLCVDRELLALEAKRTGFLDDPAVKHEIELESASLLYAAIHDKVLVPGIAPTAAQIDTSRAGGLFRRAKMAYILSVADKKATFELLEAMRHGADFDSIARQYSVHPSASKGGEVGWRRVGLLNSQSWAAFKTARPGER